MITFLLGYCPMGCGQTLVAAPGRYITCTKDDCPRPDAVSALLADGEVEHIVELKATTFTIQHPIRERLDGDLFTCALHTHIQAFAAPPYPPGFYRLSLDRDMWVWNPHDTDLMTKLASGLPVCPDCHAGKHRNCDGVTWDNEADDFARCPCTDLAHIEVRDLANPS